MDHIKCKYPVTVCILLPTGRVSMTVAAASRLALSTNGQSCVSTKTTLASRFIEYVWFQCTHYAHSSACAFEPIVPLQHRSLELQMRSTVLFQASPTIRTLS